jgi:hypothetical protein
VFAPVIVALQSTNVDAQTQIVRLPKRSQTLAAEKEKMNAWTVGLAGGLLEGAPIRLAAEIARVAGGPNMHILPSSPGVPGELLWAMAEDTAKQDF